MIAFVTSMKRVEKRTLLGGRSCRGVAGDTGLLGNHWAGRDTCSLQHEPRPGSMQSESKLRMASDELVQGPSTQERPQQTQSCIVLRIRQILFRILEVTVQILCIEETEAKSRFSSSSVATEGMRCSRTHLAGMQRLRKLADHLYVWTWKIVPCATTLK